MDFMKDMKEETFYVKDMRSINHYRNLVAEERVAALDEGVNSTYTLAKLIMLLSNRGRSLEEQKLPPPNPPPPQPPKKRKYTPPLVCYCI